MNDLISRNAAIDKFIDGLEEIFADIRERHVDDSVCGLCEYDGAYIGESGDWYNECPGFERDDCFKLSEKIRKKWTNEIIKALQSAQPERLTDYDFETIRIHMNAYKEKLCNQQRWKEAEEYQRIIDRFMAFASAQPERKRGKWKVWNILDYAQRPTGRYVGECPFCGYLTDEFKGLSESRHELTNFCSNCGADMRGEADE